VILCSARGRPGELGGIGGIFYGSICNATRRKAAALAVVVCSNAFLVFLPTALRFQFIAALTFLTVFARTACGFSQIPPKRRDLDVFSLKFDIPTDHILY